MHIQIDYLYIYIYIHTYIYIYITSAFKDCDKALYSIQQGSAPRERFIIHMISTYTYNIYI